MERLTKRELANVGGRELVLCNHKKEDCNDSCMYESGCKWRHKALRKLKEYEDAEEKNIKTNGDKIRSMSDEQLAFLLASIEMPDEDMMIICEEEFFAENEILDWLKEGSDQGLEDTHVVPDTNVGDKWIPCGERLPEEGEEVLIATITSDKIYFGMYTKRYGFSMREGFICGEDFMWLNTAIAWMPLPEPYKGE